MTYLYLLIAVLCEAGWATSMKLSQGFARPLPSAAMFTLYILSLAFLTLAARRLELSMAYAVWVGAGMAFIAIIGIVCFHEGASVLKLVSLALVAAGVIGLHLSGVAAPPEAQAKAIAHELGTQHGE
jgi:small multidrug resistance pump